MSDKGDNPLTELQRRRWRLAFAAIISGRAFVSLHGKLALDKKKQIPPALPSVTVDIHDDDLLPSFWVDNRLLIEQLVREKNLATLSQLGGVQQIAINLQSNEKDGIKGNDADLAARIKVFGDNKCPDATPKSFLSFVYEAFKDNTMIILLVCGLISLALSIKRHGLKDVPYDGGASTVFIVFPLAFVSAVRNFMLNKQLQKLLDDSTVRVQVIRDGHHQFISKVEVVVGDIVCLKTGDEIPADGLLSSGNFLQVNEYGVARESNFGEIKDSNNPFLLSGTKVLDGNGSMLVTAVGINTAWVEMMGCFQQHDFDEPTPLQARLSKMNSFVRKANLAVAFLIHVVLLIRYFIGNPKDDKRIKEFLGGKTKLDSMINSVVDIISTAISIVVVAGTEGLPLALTLVLACSLKQMMADHAIARKLYACDMMGSATTICVDKTGTLTLNEMKVTEFWLGRELIKRDNSLSFEIAPTVYELLQQSVGLNTSCTVSKRSSGSAPEISDSPTEEQAILFWAVSNLGMNLYDPKQDNKIIKQVVEALNSKNKRSGFFIKRNDETATHTHWEGAAEMILDMCSEYYVRSGEIIAIDDEERIELKKIIQKMEAEGLRCIAFAHAKTPQDHKIVQVSEKLRESGLTLLGLLGLKDPCHPSVRRAIKCCRNAGVNIKMITGDNVFTAKAIALECGILQPDDEDMIEAVIEGEQFRKYSLEEQREKINKIRVMAGCSPSDKLLMLHCLKHSGHVVAVIADDVTALKEADIGLSMGIQGTEIAKKSSDIVIMNDNFTSVVEALRCGRYVHNNIRKFIQFQLTANLSALTFNFVASIFSGEFPLTPLQLLWVSLITDAFGALALASESPTDDDDLLAKPPNPIDQSKCLISKVMWRNIIAQALYQVAIVLTFYFKGTSIFGVDKKVKNMLLFNTFVLCQVFNEFNVRKLEKEKINAFNGLHKNKTFIGILGLTLLLQAVIVELSSKLSQIQRLDLGQWGTCIGAAALSLPVTALVKWIHCQMVK